MLSIIIPTKNEEQDLPVLLDSISRQGISNLEIIVADADSTDQTREIAREYGCKVVEGGYPAKGRNNGAKASKGSSLMFMDSDIILPPNFLQKAMHEITKRQLDVAGTFQEPISSGKYFKDIQNKFFYGTANFVMNLIENTKKPAMQNCMFATREIHEKIGGFDEELIFGEDSEYAVRAKKSGANFGILKKSGNILISPRRFQQEGLKLAAKYVYFNVGRFFGHEFRKNSKVKYFP